MQQIKKLVINPFCFNQFEKTEKADSALGIDRNEFLQKVNEIYDPKDLREGYAPFCKHLFIKNFTPAKVNYAKITKDNEHLLRTKYEARTDKELPVLFRHFPAESVPATVAEYLDIILYSKEQIQKESKDMGTTDPDADVDYDWGIIYVKPQNGDQELPMDPITAMRNALGTEHGGSGAPIDREYYAKCVAFWSEHAEIK